MTNDRQRRMSRQWHDERGAVLAHVAIALVAMIAVSALAVDYGVMFVGRREVQNAADAGALAAATSRSLLGTTTTVARDSAVAAAQANLVWGTAPDITTSDVTFAPCPAGSPGVPDTCARVNVFRTNYNRANGSPLPTFFAQLAGVNEQGVRATATAQLRAGNGTADCVKPWAMADRWIEGNQPPSPDEFNRYFTSGPNRGQVINNPDSYDSTRGWALPGDLGQRVQLYTSDPRSTIRAGFFQPVRLDGNGAHDYQWNIANCNTTPVGPPTQLDPEPGRMTGPTTHGFEDLIALDPAATWSTTLNRPVGGCMEAGTCVRSPRWIAVPVFDIDRYVQDWLAANPNAGGGGGGNGGGNGGGGNGGGGNGGGGGGNGGGNGGGGGGGGVAVPLHIVRVIGVWIDEARNANNIYGYITYYPTISLTGNPNGNNTGAFARTVVLVR